MTAQALADRCTELGLPMDRAVIAKLEKGHRQNLTIAELIILAKALGVSPVELVFPLGQQEKTEILPDEHAETWAAAKWFTGDAGFPGEHPMTWTLVRELREHDQALQEFGKERLILETQTFEEQKLRKTMTAVVGGLRPDFDLADVELDRVEDHNVRRSLTTLFTLAAELPSRRERVKRLKQDVIVRRRRLRKRGITPPPLDAEFAELDDGETEGES